MRSNLRSLISSLQNLIIENNPLIVAIIQLKNLFNIFKELPQKSSNISKKILENQAKLEKAKSMIDINSRDKVSTINLIR
ncbi:MAG: hypothetical protein ACD_20C00419G0015 [uncultured bacterium]|nr:MAG: hypothetical protein ACD_20C00419G0015 [uncultured bacterium]